MYIFCFLILITRDCGVDGGRKMELKIFLKPRLRAVLMDASELLWKSKVLRNSNVHCVGFDLECIFVGFGIEF